MADHTVPATLEEWLQGWKVSKKGNPYRQIGADYYAVFPSPRGNGWSASIGKTFSRSTWKDAETAKVALWEIASKMSASQLDKTHMGTLRPQ